MHRTIQLLIACLLFVGVLGAPSRAEACSWYDVFCGVESAIDKTKSEIERFGDRVDAELDRIGEQVGDTVTHLYNGVMTVREAVEVFVRDPTWENLEAILVTAVDTVTYLGCPIDKLTGDIYMTCFDDTETARIRAAFQMLSNTYPLYFNDINIPPATHFKSRVATVYNGDSVRNIRSAIQGRDFDAFFVGGDTIGSVFLEKTAFSSAPTPFVLASLMLHEADHGRAGVDHTNGAHGDINSFGPYGTHAKFLLLFFRNQAGLPRTSTLDCDVIDTTLTSLTSSGKIGTTEDADLVRHLFWSGETARNCRR